MFEVKPTKILIVDDEAPIRQALKDALEDEGYQTILAENGEQAVDLAARELPSLILLDIWMPGNLDGLQTLKLLGEKGIQIPVVMMSGHGTIETAVKATRLGAWDFLEKPLSSEKVSITIQNILAFQMEREEKLSLLNILRKNLSLVGEHPRLQEVKNSISRKSSTDLWCLISGEPGTGKALVAENIHYSSPRAAKPFVIVHCRGIPKDLQEIEYFGQTQDALPGLPPVKRGKLALAQGGTLYLDEVADIPVETQKQLLNKLLTQGDSQLPVSQKQTVRVIASSRKTVKELEKLLLPEFMEQFKEWTLELPKLSERMTDLPALIQHFSDDISHRGGYQPKIITPAAMRALKAYSWPGQVRELRNFVERLYILCPHQDILEHDVRYCGLADESATGTTQHDNWSKYSNFREARAGFEKEYLAKKIADNNGNISKTAEEIGLERSYLHRKIKAYNIDI